MHIFRGVNWSQHRLLRSLARDTGSFIVWLARLAPFSIGWQLAHHWYFFVCLFVLQVGFEVAVELNMLRAIWLVDQYISHYAL